MLRRISISILAVGFPALLAAAFVLWKAGQVPQVLPIRTPPRLMPVHPADYDRRLRRLGEPPAAVYPEPGALLPAHRIIAFYGNFYSKGMGILGELPESEVLARLHQEAARWRAADREMPVIPAIHYIAVTAQGDPGTDRKYRWRMPAAEIRRAIWMARKAHGIVFLDVQVGKSQAKTEVPLLDRYLRLPRVHLGMDPEFYMKHGQRPGSRIGTMDASDINWVIEHLSALVKREHLAPKILIVHRFTDDMVTRAAQIHPTPQVQVVMDMDGWGTPQYKKNTYRHVITREPVEFAGIKLFYKNDVRVPGSRLMTPAEVLELRPQPVYIQYQ